MGCTTSVRPKPNRTQSTDYTQPRIEPETINLFPTSIFPVSERACGYSFSAQPTNYGKNNRESVIKRQQMILDQLKGLLEKCEYYYYEHDIDTAYKYLQKTNNFVSNHENDQQNRNEIERLVVGKRDLMKKIDEEYKDVISYEKQILKGGWAQKSNKKGLKISTRREETTVGVLVQATIDQPFQYLIAALIEMSLYKQFMPFMKVSRQEKIVQRNCRIGYTQNHIPIISVREAFFQGIGYNRLDTNNRLFLFTRSIHNRPDLQQKLGYKCKINEDWIQLVYKYLVIQYQPINKTKGKIVLAMNVDIKLDFLPMWIQDKVSQDFGEEFLANIIAVCKKFKGSQWQKNTNENPQIFLFFKNAIQKYLKERENTEQ